MTKLEWYHYPKQYAQFLSETKNHEMTILHEDGLYRHLRFAEPGTRMWSFDLVTWPNYLSITGDIGDGYSFTRIEDMLEFFDQGQPDGHINPGYWAEKCTRSGRYGTRSFSSEMFCAYVDRLVADWSKRLPSTDAKNLREEVTDSVLPYSDYEHEALDALYNFKFNGEALDNDMDQEAYTDYDHHFIIALHAILYGAKRYHADRK